MKIIKYKKETKGLYKVELEDGRVLSLYEDVKKDMPGDITSKLEEHQYTMRLESQYKGKMTLME